MTFWGSRGQARSEIAELEDFTRQLSARVRELTLGGAMGGGGGGGGGEGGGEPYPWTLSSWME